MPRVCPQLEDKKMRSYAVIPPILLDTQQRKLTFVNNNGHIEDYSAEYKERTHLNLWTDQEREQFKDKYLQVSGTVRKQGAVYITKI